MQHQSGPSAPTPARHSNAEDDLADRLGLKMINVNVSVGGGDMKAPSKRAHVTKSAPRPPTPNSTSNLLPASVPPMLFQMTQQQQHQMLAHHQHQQKQQEDLQALLCLQQQQLQQQHQQLQQQQQQYSETISDAARSLASLAQDPSGSGYIQIADASAFGSAAKSQAVASPDFDDSGHHHHAMQQIDDARHLAGGPDGR